MPKIKNIIEEAQYMLENKLDYRLIKIFSEEWEGTHEERKRLDDIQKKSKDDLYIEIIYILTHKIIKDVKEAKNMYQEIIVHKDNISKKLKRAVGIEVAALDYMKNIRSVLYDPVIIDNDKLLKLATKAIIDEETTLYDCVTLHSNLEAEIDRSKRYGHPLSILFCDMDDFTKINDIYGHESGDETLREVSRSIQEILRTTDRAFRYGGEEFVCILPETDLKAAGILARRLRKKIQEMKLYQINSKSTFNVTISIGVAEFGKNRVYDKISLIHAADQAMYQAKANGKNQVCLYGMDIRNQKKKNKNSTRRTKRIVINGNTISKGLAIGEAFIYRDVLSRDLISYVLKETEIKEEFNRIEKSLEQVLLELQKTKEIVATTVAKQHADIFEAHKMILKDERILKDLEKEMNREMVNAEQVVKNVFQHWSNRFRASDDEMIQSKADDMDDLGRRILRELLGYDKNVLEKLPPNSIIVAKRLLPSDTVHLSSKNIKGVVTEEGGYNSHSAIIARALGVPAVCQLDKSISNIKKGAILLLYGENGKVVVNPTVKEKERFRTKLKTAQVKNNIILTKTREAAITIDGTKILIYANASNEEDFKKAKKMGCDGIGLFRVESLYLEHKTAPEKDYLINRFKNILKCLPNKEIIIRLLDVGGDKRLPYLNVEKERNPFLGLRGIRLLLTHRKLLETQIEVILDLYKNFDVSILIPMVTLPDEIIMVKDIITKLQKSFKTEKRNIKIGSMIETPAAVTHINKIVELSDFLSIGTNDLIQYTMAAGREKMNASEYYDQGAKTVMMMIERVIIQANKGDIGCGVCGEIAGDTKHIKGLLSVGVRNLSVAPSLIPFVKNEIRKINLK